MPRKVKVAYKEGFKRKTAAKIHFKAFLLSVDKWLANRQIHKSFPIKILRYTPIRWFNIQLNNNVDTLISFLLLLHQF